MPGPPPKPAAQRRRRNATPASTPLPAEGRRGRPPKPQTREIWGEQAKDYWTAIWTSPMAVVFTKSDHHALTRLCSLVHQASTGEANAALLAEIRQLEDRFGLSPLARRRLQWEIDQAEGGAAPAPKGDEEDGRWLRAV